jgi:hypothetical protein
MPTFTTIPGSDGGTLYTDSVVDVISQILGYDVMSIDPDNDSQSWFWTEAWQAMEREAEHDIEAGRVRHFDDLGSFLEDLDDQ